jgi:large subunit ribosomal protein L18
MFVQLIDDSQGVTLVSASTLEAEFAGSSTGNCDAAKKVGQAIALRAVAHGVSRVVFDRGGFQYHGRVAALADAAREAGLEF